MKSLVYVISDILSIITISLCFVGKVPQIIHLVKAESTTGLSFHALLLEISSYTITMMYNFTHGHDILTYLEYPILLAQDYIIMALLYRNSKFLQFIGIFALYQAICGIFIYGFISKEILKLLLPTTTPIGATSKLMQLVKILQTQNADSVSATAWFISAFTNITRIYTIYFDSCDTTLLINFALSSILSSAVLSATLYFQKKATPKKVE